MQPLILSPVSHGQPLHVLPVLLSGRWQSAPRRSAIQREKRRSALRVPMERAANANAARCNCLCTALRFLCHIGPLFGSGFSELLPTPLPGSWDKPLEHPQPQLPHASQRGKRTTYIRYKATGTLLGSQQEPGRVPVVLLRRGRARAAISP